MNIRLIKFTGVSFEDGPVLAEQEIGPDFFSRDAEELPAAYVALVGDLEKFRKFGELVIDRGRKHKAKGLSKLLLGQKKTVLIDGDFSDPGQLRRSIRTLLENAADKGEQNRYVIGAGQDIFETLWRQAQPACSGKAPATGPERIAPVARDTISYDCGEMTSDEFLGLLNGCIVPPELLEDFKGRSVEARLVRKLIVLAAKSDHKVLILGDTGTGKEVVARAIHKLSPRAGKFTAVNCSGIPRELLESELFGHEKGAFTGAVGQKAGLWEDAKNGTLFLDEIGDLSLEHQAKVLRALEDGEIRRVGGKETLMVDARIIAATNRDLHAMVVSGQFREDLYYRLREFLIHIKPLRERTEDIPLLARHYWGNIVGDGNKPLPADVAEELKKYGWMGNVRELKTVLAYFHDIFREERLSVHGLRAIFRIYGQTLVSKGEQTPSRELGRKDMESVRHLRSADERIRACEVSLSPMTVSPLAPGVLASVQDALRMRLNELEMLCVNPLLFKSEALFCEINMFKGKLAYLQGLLQKDGGEAATFWEKEGAEVAAKVRSAIAVEIKGLLGNPLRD
ncbi:MAG: sigma 54-interacting transcriptional regulator [Syntrophobacteraceae bacterium]